MDVKEVWRELLHAKNYLFDLFRKEENEDFPSAHLRDTNATGKLKYSDYDYLKKMRRIFGPFCLRK